MDYSIDRRMNTLPPGKYLVWLWQGYDRLIISNDKKQYYFDLEKEAYDHLLWVKDELKIQALKYSYSIKKIKNLKFEVKQIA